MINFIKSNLNGNEPDTTTSSTTTNPTDTTTTETTSQTTSSTTTKDNSNDKCPNGDGYYADKETSCRNFYYCLYTGTSNAIIYQFTCPAGLLFDQKLKICNYPNVVVC